jgi:hypothetical protein
MKKIKIDKNQVHLFDLFTELKGANSKYKYQNYLRKMYFSLSPKRPDIEAVRKARPKNLLLSYALWKNQNGIYKFGSFVESLWADGYRPTIILDSGAFSFSSKEVDISLSDYRYRIEDTFERELTAEELALDYLQAIYYGGIDMEEDEEDGCELLNYIKFIYENSKYIDYVVSLDHFSQSDVSLENYKFLRGIGINSIPTFHMGEDYSVLEEYTRLGADYIGLGGTVPVKLGGGNGVNALITSWINKTLMKYPGIKFHLFGCQDPKILDKCLPSLYSSDGAAWIISAANKYNREVGINDKIRLAVINIEAKECVGI